MLPDARRNRPDAESCDPRRRGNHYFLECAGLPCRARRTTCSWKGVASYYDVVVDGREPRRLVLPDPKAAAERSALRRLLASSDA
jgi:hypothetical protein